ncbi:MAG: ABC transporter ATP-binding protein/permease [Symbiobacteriaceae bacterium]|nr:ABC transporter ATP-binding protein/permease [Symbiobacteriaceae bacterium]
MDNVTSAPSRYAATPPTYSPFSALAFAVGIQWQERPLTVICSIASIFLRVLVPFLGIYLPKLVIDELTRGSSPQRFVTVVGGYGFMLACFSTVRAYTDFQVDQSIGTMAQIQGGSLFFAKQVHMDYEAMEDPYVIALNEKAMRARNSNHSPAQNVMRIFVLLAANIGGFLLYGGVILQVHPLIIVLLALSAAISWFFLKRARELEKSQREERSTLWSQVTALKNYMSRPNYAKDMRLYAMSPFMEDVVSSLQAEQEALEITLARGNAHASLANALLILLRDGAAYLFLINMLLRGDIALGDFVFVFAAIGTFATWVSGIILQGSDIARAVDELGDIRRYLDVASRRPAHPVPIPHRDAPPTIVLENLSYTYPGTNKPIIDNISLTIPAGERLAIVGVNGAGKTTLIKLICGLYTPTQGRILYNGVDLQELDPLDYFTRIAVVFQDIHLMGNSIALNVSQTTQDATEIAKVHRVLQQADFWDKVQSLPLKEHTMLVRQIHDDAIELSGGEMQKLALARALYKDAPLIILDEPTAALDPLAENLVYQRYAELTAGKSSIYISHRLASTRFCNRILLISQGKIVEEGNHEELMAQGGEYAAMFAIQAHYYKEELKSIGGGAR